MLRRHVVCTGGVVVMWPLPEPLPPAAPVAAQCEVFNDWVVANDPAIPLTWRTRAGTVGPMFARSSSSESYPSSPKG
jgi:hypothetical protein